MIRSAILACLIFIAGFDLSPAHSRQAILSDDDRATAAAFAPWPPRFDGDASNWASKNETAIALGAQLFFDPALSAAKDMSCASCHNPEQGLGDGVALGHGKITLSRNTPGLFNLGHARWFGWDGAADSLWAQSIRPMVSAEEMAASPAYLKSVLTGSPDYSCAIRQVFGKDPAGLSDEQAMVQIAKALAAYQETLVTAWTPFDAFADAVRKNDAEGIAAYPDDAKRGFKIFVGEGRCNLCHFGPNFTNGEFADVGVPFFIAPGKVDKGRYGGIDQVKASPYNRLGRFNDDPNRTDAVSTRHVEKTHRNWGEFKVPSLRNTALTAPYMHNGSLATLRDVIDHYSELNEERLHSDGEKILRPLNLSNSEKDDLEAFLNSLTAPLIDSPYPPKTIPGCE